jgi:hypothetical protein
MTTKNLLAAALLAAATAGAPMEAAESTDCTDHGIALCNQRLPPGMPLLTPVRGWCYILVLYQCNVFET